MEKNGVDPLRVLFRFCFSKKKIFLYVMDFIICIVPLSLLFCFQEFSFCFPPSFIHSPCQTGSQPMSGHCYIFIIFQTKVNYKRILCK